MRIEILEGSAVAVYATGVCCADDQIKRRRCRDRAARKKLSLIHDSSAHRFPRSALRTFVAEMSCTAASRSMRSTV
jgi:hypothetical protein